MIATGEGHVTTRPRSGRPRVISQQESDNLVAAVTQAPRTTAVSLTRDLGLRCHPVTTRRRLREAGLNCHVPAVKEVLSEQNKAARLRFAQNNIRHGLDFWRKVIFTDEKCFSSVSKNGRHCWRLRNTRYEAKHINERARSGRVTVSFHGWMWAGGPGELVKIEGHLNSEEYINILETSLLPSVRAYALPEPENIILVQDRSPIHTSRVVTQWFREHPEIQLVDWPPKGCDVNPIENLWGIMVEEWEVPQMTTAAVEAKATEVWESIRRRPDICTKLVDSVRTRLQEVIDAQGGWTKY